MNTSMQAGTSGRAAGLSARSSPFATGAALRASSSRQAVGRTALVVEAKESRIGKQPVVVPSGITITVEPGKVTVKGAKAQLSERFNPDLVEIKETEEKGTWRVSKRVDTRQANMTHGLTRSLLVSMVEGLSGGFTKTLKMIGVGYRGLVEGRNLTLNLGYSNPVVMPIPEGIEVQVERATTLHVKGYDKCAVGQFAADIRSKRPPEPYKGKGVRYENEFVAKKEGKKGKK